MCVSEERGYGKRKLAIKHMVCLFNWILPWFLVCLSRTDLRSSGLVDVSVRAGRDGKKGWAGKERREKKKKKEMAEREKRVREKERQLVPSSLVHVARHEIDCTLFYLLVLDRRGKPVYVY